MCLPTSNAFSDLSLHDLFSHCDDLASESIGDKKTPRSNSILSYLAWSSHPNFLHEVCFNAMSDRIPPDDPSLPTFHFHYWESPTFKRRLKLISSNNKAYELATKINPSVADLEEFSKIDPCFSTLYPVKMFLSDHPEMATNYRGMLPFGKEVVKYYNSMVSDDDFIKGSPSFKDHVRLREISNRKAILMGMPSLTINNLMYQFGRLLNAPEDISDEE